MDQEGLDRIKTAPAVRVRDGMFSSRCSRAQFSEYTWRERQARAEARLRLAQSVPESFAAAAAAVSHRGSAAIRTFTSPAASSEWPGV